MALMTRFLSKPQDKNDRNTEAVRWAYRLFLDREPESEDVLLGRSTSTAALRSEFMASPEFNSRNSRLTLFHDDWVIKETKHGFRIFVYLNEIDISRNILIDQYETAEVSFVSETVKKGNRVIDIGANIGYYSMLFSAIVGPTGKVLSFEPIRHLFDKLSRSRSENAFESVCEIYNCALSDTTGVANMVYAPEAINFGGSHLTHGAEAPAQHAIASVELRKLDEFSRDGRVDFIKIDVEGAEPLVFSGGRELIARDMPIILCEVHNDQLKNVSSSSATDMIAAMTNLGYRCNLLTEAGAVGEEIAAYDHPEPTNVVFSKAC